MILSFVRVIETDEEHKVLEKSGREQKRANDQRVIGEILFTGKFFPAVLCPLRYLNSSHKNEL